MPPSSCELMARAADRIAAAQKAPDPRQLVVDLALEVAGIRIGMGAVWGLLTGGRTVLRGGGFRADLKDGSAGQSRHFVGTARAVTVFGAPRTLWLSEHARRDARDGPDGRLTQLAVEFASRLDDGSLAVADAGDWIRAHVCA